MKVSVIVLTYNRAGMVVGAIDSILNQTFQDFELIVVDNFSSDDTEQVIKGYRDKRIRYFKHENGGVLAVNRNFGIENARGEYIAFCDDDDLWLPEKLERQMLEFQKDSHLGIVCTNGIIFDETGELGKFHSTGFTDKDFALKSLLWESRIICSSVLVKKSAVYDVGLLDTSPDIFTSEDYEFWLRVIKKYGIRYIELPLVKYRLHPGAYNKGGVAAIKRNRAVYRKLLDKGTIRRSLYWILIVRALVIEFLWRTGTIGLASRIKRLTR